MKRHALTLLVALIPVTLAAQTGHVAGSTISRCHRSSRSPTTTFQIRRSVVHLSRHPTQMPELLDMEVTAEFFEVLPSIPIISHVRSIQTMDPKRKSLVSAAYEEHLTTKFRWVGRKPGEARQP